jgi:hypothetical protein
LKSKNIPFLKAHWTEILLKGKIIFLNISPLKCASLGWAPALPAYTRLGWKGVPGKSALAYYEKAELITVKTFYNIGLRPQLILFFTLIDVEEIP